MSKPLEGKRIVLIGGAGFIGHNMALALVRRGAHVEVIDSLQVNNLLRFASAHTHTHGGNHETDLRLRNRRQDLPR